MRSTDIIYKDRNVQSKPERTMVVVFIDAPKINCDFIKKMIQIKKTDVVRMVRICSSNNMIERMNSYVMDLGIDKGKGDRIYLYSEGRLMPYDCIT